MRRGQVEISHDPINQSLQFKVIRSEKDEEGKKAMKDLAFEVKLEDFKEGFLEAYYEETKEMKVHEAVEMFFKETAQLREPYDPSNGEALAGYLALECEGREVEEGTPAFPLEISAKWDEEKKALNFTMLGMDNDIIRALHAMMIHNPKFDHLLSVVVTEKAGAMKGVMEMEEAAEQAKSSGK